MDGLTFSYYTNGTVEGETAEAKKESNIEIDGKTYNEGFSFPLVTDNQYVGVKFKAPIMPMSPSARLKIDYSGIKALSVEESETTVTEESETQPEIGTSKQNEDITVMETISGEAEPESESQVEKTVTQSSSASENKVEESTLPAQDETDEKSFPIVPVIAEIAIAAAAVTAALIIKKKK